VTPDGVFTPSGADLTNALPVMSEDGTDLYVGDGGNDQLHVLDLTAAGPTLTPIQSIDFGAAVGEPRLALSEDESMLAALPGGTNTVLFYDRQAGGQLQTPPRTVTLPTFVTLYDGVVFMPNASRAILRAGTDVHLVSTGVGGTVLDSLTLQSPTGSVSAVPGRWRAAIMEPSLTRMTVVQALANDTLEVVGAHDFSVLTSFELSAIPAITPDGQIGILPSSSAAPLGGGFLVDLEQTGINSLALIGGQRGATNAVAVDKQGVVLASLDTDSNSLVAQLIARSDPPRIATATLVETTGAFPDGTGGPGDIIQLTFDRPLRPGGGLVGAGDFFLQGGGSLGSSAFVFPVDISLENFATNRAQILLGIGATVNTTAPSVAIDIGPSPTNSLLRSFADGRVAQDLGVVGALDSGVPITQPMFETGSDFSELGGFVQLPGLQGALFTLSSFAMQPGILSETIYIFIGPPPFAFPQAGFLNAVQLRAEAPLPDFDPPATLTVQYDPTGLSSESGESEKFLRIVQLVDMGGEIVPFPLEGTMFIDTVNKTISTEITSLDPTGMAAASESHPRGPSGPVGVFATLPVNPVEERSIFIAPGGAAGASAQSPGAISLSSGDGSVYPNHLISFPGFVQTSGSDPNRIQISVRSSTLFDRVSLGGGTSFPEQSGAIFTVETKNASGQPVAFTSPVDITVQFIERPAANETDAVDFNSIAGDPNQMRMVQDVLAGIGADFEFIGGSVNGSVVTRSGHTPLTDASGAGTFGAVIDPNAVASLSLQDIVNHILGVSVLSQQSAYFLQADLAEPFQVLDAADLVLFVLAHQDEGQPEPRNP
jgi:hypothetical protein